MTEPNTTGAEADKGDGERPSEAPDPERAFERLAEDEALRRDLDDATFGPLLDLSASLAVALAKRFASTGELYDALRGFLLGAAEYARSGETVELAQGFGALLTEDESNMIWFSLAAAESPEARAANLARSVAAATGIEETA